MLNLSVEERLRIIEVTARRKSQRGKKRREGGPLCDAKETAACYRAAGPKSWPGVAFSHVCDKRRMRVRRSTHTFKGSDSPGSRNSTMEQVPACIGLAF